MQTKLSHFCDLFVAAAEPLLKPIEEAIQALEVDAAQDQHEVRAELADLHLQVESLVKKVAGQRSYVLIFGPLKSGKSTLMNAIAASYVSEVSSLPAYPCLVFVSHNENREFVVTDYNHNVETFKDSKHVHQRIEEAHAELAEHIREAEDAGEIFDPQVHFPSAIRRVDVHVPAKNLEESGAVLVDTPGLYTRMRFGYDRMTRDFRNAAACAIFVVKSDTLFLEQVFDEFNQLLQLFNRIFLVVNIDSTKRDIGPGGELVPSLEQADPARIIKAFEDLSMPTPLKQAAAEGRVRIFPVDLMDAASTALRGAKPGPSGFARFQGELNSYLASTDYLLAFLTDSMHRAQHLIEEAEQLGKSPFAEQLREDIHALDQRHANSTADLKLLLDCRARDWASAFEPFAEEVTQTLTRVSRDLGARVTRDMSASIETWFLSSHSLQWLLTTVWGPLIADFHNALDDAARRCLEQSVFHRNAGIALDQDTAQFMRNIGVDARELRQAAITALADRPRPVGARFPLEIDQIPLRRGVFDVVAFRSTNKVRERLFGPATNPDTKITARQKAARLGEAAKKHLNQFILGYKDQFFKKAVRAATQRYADDVATKTINAILQQLEKLGPQLEENVKALASRRSQLRQVLSPIDNLAVVSKTVGAQVSALDRQFGAADVETLLTPHAKEAAVGNSKTREASRRA